MSILNFRPAQLKDIDQVYNLEQKAFPIGIGFNLKTLTKYITKKQMTVLENDSGLIIGNYILWSKRFRKWAKLQSIAVHPAFQGDGYGSMLLAHAENRTIFEHRKTKIILEVPFNNRSARDLYQKREYRLTGIIAGYYDSGRIDAITMEKQLKSVAIDPLPY